jgi:hypothetical protein
VADDPDPTFTLVQREISRPDTAIDKVVVSETLSPEQTEPLESRQSLRLIDIRTWDASGNVLLRYQVSRHEA